MVSLGTTSVLRLGLSMPRGRGGPWGAAVFGALLAMGAHRLAVAQPAPGPGAPQQGYDERGRAREAPPEEPKRPTGPITRPEVRNYVAPRYPEQARADAIEGEVILRLDIDEDGKVTAVEVHQSGGHGFDEAATEAAYKLTFSPARTAEGNPFAARILFRYEFTLEETLAPPATGPSGAPGSEPAPAANAAAVAPAGSILELTLLIEPVDEPLVGASVRVEGSDGSVLVVSSDARGQVRLTGLAAGEYRVSVSAAGYRPVTQVERLGEREQTSVTYRIAAELETGVIEVVVEGERPAREVTRRTLEAREIARIPGTKGDALRSIESLPGVARPPGIAGILLVRGSGPFDTQTFVDGVNVPLIYHFGGFSSVVPTELLSRIDFYPGNFSARYGRVQGGIVDAGIRSPRSDGYHGFLQMDLIDARLLLEGPIPWLEDWTFAVSARRSYLDAWLGPTAEAAGSGIVQAPRYWDYQLMVEHKPNDTDRLRTTFYGSDDAIKVLIEQPFGSTPVAWGESGLRTVFWRLQSQYDYKIGEDDEVHATLALGRDSVEVQFTQYYFLIDSYSLDSRFEYAHQLAKSAKLNLGLDLVLGSYDVGVRLPAPPLPGQPAGQPFLSRTVEQTAERGMFTRPALYAEFELEPDKRTRIVPGVRLDYALDSEQLDVSPRLNARYLIVPEFPKTTAKAGIGLYHQPPQFQESSESLGTPGIKSNRAIHYGLGVEQEFTKQFEVSLEGFYKQLDQLVRGGVATNGQRLEYANDGRGRAFGLELLAKYKPDDVFFGWLAYTLSRSVRQDDPTAQEVPVSFDQTHILTALGSAKLGRGWEVGARFRLISGNLNTPQVCDPTSDACDPNRVNALFHAASGSYAPLAFGAINDERLPVYHQLDLRIDKSWQFELWKLSAYLDIQNVYNQQNTEGITYNYNYTARQYTSGLPILPSIGARGEF